MTNCTRFSETQRLLFWIKPLLRLPGQGCRAECLLVSVVGHGPVCVTSCRYNCGLETPEEKSSPNHMPLGKWFRSLRVLQLMLARPLVAQVSL